MKNKCDDHFIDKQLTFLISFCLFVVFSNSGCSQGQVVTEIPSDWIKGLPTYLNFTADGSTQKISIELAAEIDPTQVQCAVTEDGQDWCQTKLEGTILVIVAYPSYKEMIRATTVLLTYGENHVCRIPVDQAATVSNKTIFTLK